ncbi:MAG: cytochrome c3 family protein [Gemmatimonadota bacterium]
MGRLLLIGGALALMACGGSESGTPPATSGILDAEESAYGVPPGDAFAAAHAELSCAVCHQGGSADAGRSAVPREACTSCHEDVGPAVVSIGTVTFGHREHGGDDVPLTCAGCHTHESWPAPLTAGVDACALCHAGQLTGEEPDACRTCHTQPQHVTLTSQGLPVPHSTLPWVETGCIRCHYDVAEPTTTVSAARCAACHDDAGTVAERSIGENLHPVHAGVTCTACHEAGSHHVRALSSAVALVCTDCHQLAHGQALEGPLAGSTTCAACHGTVHQAQQRLLLGLFDGAQAAPSAKFLAGITCRSCHVPAPADGPEDAVRGQATTCQACHTEEYGQVLDWWLSGIRERTRVVDRYVADAGRVLAAGASAEAVRHLDAARSMVGLVREAGGQHNLELADRLLRSALERAAEAYMASGRAPPSPPALGTRPHAGLCTYCHYGPDEPWDYSRMPAEFHERVLGGGEGGAP